jgi:hypothetical protein
MHVQLPAVLTIVDRAGASTVHINSEVRVYPGDMTLEQAQRKKLTINMSRVRTRDSIRPSGSAHLLQACGHLCLSRYGVIATPDIGERPLDAECGEAAAAEAPVAARGARAQRACVPSTETMILAASDGVWDVEENEGVVEEMTAHPDVSEVRISAAVMLLAPTHARSQSCRHLLMRCLAKWKSLFGEPNGAFRSLAEHRQRGLHP